MRLKGLPLIAGLTLTCFTLGYGVPAWAQGTTDVPAMDSTAALPPPAPVPVSPAPVPAPQAPDREVPNLRYEGRLLGERNLSVPVIVRYEERRNRGLIIGGAVTLGATYFVSSLTTSLATGSVKSCVPIIGPLLILPDVGGHDSFSGVASFWLVFDSLVQATGAALLIAGLASKKMRPVYERLQLTPYASAGSAGLFAVGRF